jgi:sporulation protein YlmC with PRC-barrel domain
MPASILTAFLLTVVAGTTAPAVAQAMDTSTKSAVVSPEVDFRSSKWLIDRKVMNSNSENIAVVSDLILHRGSGRIEYLIIKTGTTLGMGGRAIAVPYTEFTWTSDADDNAFVLPATVEQLKLYPEYTPARWRALKDATSDKTCSLRERLSAEVATSSDPYDAALDTAKSAQVAGEVKSVDRVKTSFGERVVVEVLTSEGVTERVTLGPSWYVNSAAAAPMRGDKVVVDALSLPRDPDQLKAATHLKNGDHDLALRATDGSPMWGLKFRGSKESGRSSPHTRYLLMSTLPGMKIDCRGNDCGKVQDVIIDRHSGEIGFLSIDPNQNFLGMGDTKRMIPWSVASVTSEGLVRIDASKSMILESAETPADLATLNSGTHAERVYKAFDVSSPRFVPTTPR